MNKMEDEKKKIREKIKKLQNKIDENNKVLEKIELDTAEGLFDKHLNEEYEEYEICGYVFKPSQIFKCVDYEEYRKEYINFAREKATDLDVENIENERKIARLKKKLKKLYVK